MSYKGLGRLLSPAFDEVVLYLVLPQMELLLEVLVVLIQVWCSVWIHSCPVFLDEVLQLLLQIDHCQTVLLKEVALADDVLSLDNGLTLR